MRVFTEARARFLHSANQIKHAEMHVLEVVPGYTMDIAVIPGFPDSGVVIHTSG